MPLGRRRRVRRRRAAIVAGGAYAVHKHREHQVQEQQELAQEQEPWQTDEPRPDESAAQEPEAVSGDDMTRLGQLKDLLDSGVLTQDEFDAEKQKILGI